MVIRRIIRAETSRYNVGIGPYAQAVRFTTTPDRATEAPDDYDGHVVRLN